LKPITLEKPELSFLRLEDMPLICAAFLKRALISIVPINMSKNIMSLAVRENWRVCNMEKGNRLEAAILEVLIAEKRGRIAIGK